MNSKTKENILKTVMVIEMILLSLLFPGTIIISFFVTGEKTLSIIVYTILFSFVSIGVLFIILMHLFGPLNTSSHKVKKCSLLIDNYRLFDATMSDILLKKGYDQVGGKKYAEGGEIKLYMKTVGLWEKDCIAILHFAELSDRNIETGNNCITEILSQYYCGKKITDTINLTSIFCVNKLTSAFQKLMKSKLYQNFKNGRLIIGISFGGKQVYIPQEKDGFAIYRYRRLLKNFFELMGVMLKTNVK